ACAALKNAYAMGVAFAAGAHSAAGGQPGSIARHNYESAVFAQSIYEMQQICRLLGGDPASATWLPGVGALGVTPNGGAAGGVGDLDVTTNGGRTGRFGAHLGRGIGRDKAIAAMQGATLECLHVLEVMRSAIASWERAGVLQEDELPLLRHMAAVALDDAPVSVPFRAFFGRSSRPEVPSP